MVKEHVITTGIKNAFHRDEVEGWLFAGIIF